MATEFFNILIILISVIISIFTFVNLFNKLNIKNTQAEEFEIKNDNLRDMLCNHEMNVIDLMLKNVTELREYYVISKSQARRSFSSALFISFLGIVIYMVGIISVIYLKVDVIIISTIAGTVVEAVSGLSFWLYSQSIKQLNIYHNRLASTEKYLTAIQLIDRVPDEKKYEEYKNIINFMLNDSQTELK